MVFAACGSPAAHHCPFPDVDQVPVWPAPVPAALRTADRQKPSGLAKQGLKCQISTATGHRRLRWRPGDAIRSRRNVRSYADEAIAPKDLNQILEAGRRTPSAGNQQAWDFVVCTDRGQLAQLAKVWRSAGDVARSAATIAVSAPNAQEARSRDLVQYDLGQATMSIMLAAATWASAAHTRRSAIRSWRGACWASPRIASGLADHPWCSRLTARSGRSRGPTGARSRTWCMAATGSGCSLVVGAVGMALDHPFDHPDDPTGLVWIRLDRRAIQREQAGSVWSRPGRRRASVS
jgi:nitroreductase